MQYHLLAFSLAASTTVLAAPWQDYSGKLDADGNKIVERIVFQDYSGELDAEGNKVSRRSADGTVESLSRRVTDGISTCGDNWVPINDFYNNGRQWAGYESAVTAACTHFTADESGGAVVVGPGAYTGTTITTNYQNNQVGLDNGKNPRDPANQITPGHIEIEIHNKQSDGDHIPTCKLQLLPFSLSLAPVALCVQIC